VLKRPKESIQVLVGDIGGGFGQKTNFIRKTGMVAYAAVKLGRKVALARRPHRRVRRRHPWPRPTSTGEFALDAKGRVLAYRVCARGRHRRLYHRRRHRDSLGARSLRAERGVRSPLVHYEVKAVMTNTAPVGAIAARAGRKPYSSSSG